MSDVLISTLGALIYLSGLVVWPTFALLWRKKKRRTTALRWVFFIELLCMAVIVVLATFKIVKLEHGYDWFIVWIPLNFLFTLAGLLAAIYDFAQSETATAKPPT